MGTQAIGAYLNEPTHNQICMNFLPRLEADFARIRFWEGFYNIVQDELDVSGLELSPDHLAELDGVRLVENECMAVDDGNLLGLWGRVDEGIEITITRREPYWILVSELPRQFWKVVNKRVRKRLDVIPSPTAPAPTKRMSSAALNLEPHSSKNMLNSSFELGKLSGPGQCEPMHTARTRSV